MVTGVYPISDSVLRQEKPKTTEEEWRKVLETWATWLRAVMRVRGLNHAAGLAEQDRVKALRALRELEHALQTWAVQRKAVVERASIHEYFFR